MTYRTARIGVTRLSDGATITRADRDAWRDYQAWLDAGGVPEPLPVVPPVLLADEAYKREARRKIDEAAGRARARYITTVPGQDATYSAKYADALRYIADSYPSDPAPYPWVAAEAAATGLTTTQVADRIQQLGAAWGGVIGPQIEGARLAGKEAIAPMTTRTEIDAHVAAVGAALGEI